jgi:hypothetical protein
MLHSVGATNLSVQRKQFLRGDKGSLKIIETIKCFENCLSEFIEIW